MLLSSLYGGYHQDLGLDGFIICCSGGGTDW